MKHITDRQLSALIDEDLSAEGRELVETHCAECAACAQRKNEYLAMQRMVRRLPQLELQEDYAFTRIRARIASGEADQSEKARGWQMWHSLAALGSTALIAFALIFTLSYTGNIDNSIMLSQDSNVVERETDDIIRGYQDMQQLYYF